MRRSRRCGTGCGSSRRPRCPPPSSDPTGTRRAASSPPSGRCLAGCGRRATCASCCRCRPTPGWCARACSSRRRSRAGAAARSASSCSATGGRSRRSRRDRRRADRRLPRGGRGRPGRARGRAVAAGRRAGPRVGDGAPAGARAAVPLQRTDLQHAPHPLRPALRDRRRGLPRPGRARPADGDADARRVPRRAPAATVRRYVFRALSPRSRARRCTAAACRSATVRAKVWVRGADGREHLAGDVEFD